jgi:type III secretion system YscQ/HrcQ family protein
MNIVRLDESALALLRQLGAGRGGYIECAGEAVGLSVNHATTGGAGLVLTRKSGSQAWSVWVDEYAWCSWVASHCPAPDLDAVPHDLLMPLAAWTLAPLSACIDADAVAMPVFDVARKTCEVEPDWVVTLTDNEGRTLEARLLGWSAARVSALMDTLEPLSPQQASDCRLPLSLVAGATQLSAMELGRLTAGAGLVLDWACEVEAGHFCLFQRKQLAFLRQLENGAWQVEDLLNEINEINSMPSSVDTAYMDNIDSTSPNAAAALADVTFTVVAEIAQIELSLSELSSLTPGELLDVPASAGDGRVTLKVNQRTIAHGRLIRVGERLMVRIEA